MKKQLLFLSSVLATGMSFSQVLLSENFDGGTTLPSGWTQQNVDGLSVASNLSAYSFGTNAWVVRANAVTGTGNHAVSTSWYTPAGVSNDWLITPQIVVPATGTYVLQFKAMAPDASFPDGFKVYASTTGNAVADFGTTPILTQNAAPQTYTTFTVSLSAYAGQSIYLAIQNFNNDKYLLFVDDIIVRQPQADDAILNSVALNRYSAVNANNTLALSVTNDGSTPITSLTVNWNDGADHSSVITTNIAPGATATINHPTAVTYATAVEKDIEVTITGVNGNTDPNMSNNDAEALFNTVSQMADKSVVIEEGTGTWCGWCPRGAVAMDYMESTYPNDFIGIAVHNSDPMTVAAYDAAANFSGFPGCNVDRALLDMGVSQAAFEQYYQDRIDMIVPAAINATKTLNGSNLQINVSTTFYTTFAASNFRLGVIMTEDDVTGTSSGYNQTNYYEGGSQGAMGGYESLPDPVPAAQMVYNHVGRALLGGYDGQAGSVPAAITDGQTVNYTFNYTIPATSTANDMHAVAVLIDNNTGEIVNAKQIPVTTLGIEEIATIGMEVFPNPAADKVNVKFEAKQADYSIAITDLAGRTLSTQQVSNANGTQKVEVSLAGISAGNYLITVATEGASYTQPFVVK
jgi:hypothetical protein